MSISNLWDGDDCERWQEALDNYPEVIAAQGSDRLAGLDRWYDEELPQLVRARDEPLVTLEELQQVAAWKMTRGVWRERNRQLIAGNPPEVIKETSRKAFAASPDPRKPITLLSELAGVGPATASAVMAAYAPEVYPFFDELVAGQIGGLGPVAFTAKYYAAYAEALRARAGRLSAECGRTWTPHGVAQALWANSGGKASI